MRVSVEGIEPSGQPVRFTFDGREIVADSGDSVASALIAAGIRGFREANTDDMRGVFCGMGVCSECSVVIDGSPGLLACMTPVEPGMVIESHPQIPPMPQALVEAATELNLAPDVLVIGGGPAGLTTALTTARAGLEVVLVDERAKLGGQYFKQPPESGQIDEECLDAQYTKGRHLIHDVAAAGVEVLLGVRVWGAFSPTHIMAAGPHARYTIRPRSLVLASGAYERGVPLPGWTLPGVMTTGAAQTLLRANQVSPGSRVLVSGNGPLNLQVAAEMVKSGVKVVGLAEVADIQWWSRLRIGASLLVTVPSLALRGLWYRMALARAHVPVMSRTSVIAVEGRGHAERAIVARLDNKGKVIAGTERTFDVDVLCVGFGFMPSNEIARSLGCSHQYDATRGYLVADLTISGRATVEGVWAVGDSAGVGGAQLAMAAGVLAAADIIETTGRILADAVTAERSRATSALRRHARFQKYLWSMYEAPVLTLQLALQDTLVCRCETVTLRDLEIGIDSELHTAGALKRVTRAGMGKCQGRYCSPIMASLAATQSGLPIDEFSGFAPQPPVKPTEISTIATPQPPNERHCSRS